MEVDYEQSRSQTSQNNTVRLIPFAIHEYRNFEMTYSSILRFVDSCKSIWELGMLWFCNLMCCVVFEL